MIQVYAYGPVFNNKLDMARKLVKPPFSVPANCIQDAGEPEKLDIYMPDTLSQASLVDLFDQNEVEYRVSRL